MVKVNSSCIYSKHPACEPPDISCMIALPESRKPGCTPSYLNSGTSVISYLPRIFGSEFSGVPNVSSHQMNVAYDMPHVFPSHHQALLSDAILYPPNKASVWSYEHGGGNELHEVLGLSEKKFAVFDHSENHKRWFHTSQNCSYNENALRTELAGHFTSLREEHAVNPTWCDLSGAISLEEIDENHIVVEENERHEDTEEINALLYSDDDEDSEEEEDEVMSTGHSPCVIEEVNAESDRVEQIVDGLPGSDYINKRQKLMTGGYNKIPPNNTTSVKLNGYHNCHKDSSSSFAAGQTDEEDRACLLDNKQLRKAKIRQTLQILEAIIPGVKDKDPLVILDQAIDYLKAMKLEGKIHGLNFH